MTPQSTVVWASACLIAGLVAGTVHGADRVAAVSTGDAQLGLLGWALAAVMFAGLLAVSIGMRQFYRNKCQLLQTEIERLEERLQTADSQRSRFVEIASFDLRSPITAIVGFLDWIDTSDTELPRQVRDSHLHIREGCSQMISILDDILDLARFDVVTSAPVFESVDLNTLCESVCEDLKLFAVRNDQRIYLDLTADCVAWADLAICRTVLSNALNAFTTTAVPRAAITLRTRHVGAQVWLELEYELTHAEHQKPSQLQLDWTEIPANASSGMLLAGQLLERIQGEIHCFNAPGKGLLTRLCFQRPRKHAAA